MAFNVNFGNIIETFTDTLNEAFGLGGGISSEKGGTSRELFSKDLYGSVDLDKSRWVGNSGPIPKDLRYGFAIVELQDNGKGLKSTVKFDSENSNLFLLQIAPQQIQQKEIFATNVQATRKGVIVESEGVVFKDIVLSGNTGIFPGERGGSNTASPNFGNFLAPPTPPQGVDPEKGISKKNGEKTISGYEEFLRLRQFFLKYAKLKVEKKGSVFLAFINQKDNQYLVAEPLDFSMYRNAKSPMTYDYRITLKAIATLDDLIAPKNFEDDNINFLDQIANLSANVSALLASSTEVLNGARGALVSITQGIDTVLFTPLRQLSLAINSLQSGTATFLSVPSILFRGGQGAVSQIQLAVAEAENNVNSVIANYASSQRTSVDPTQSSSTTNTPTSSSGIIRDSFGNITSTGTGSSTSDNSNTLSLSSALDANTINGETPNILNDDGSLNDNLTPEQFVLVKELSSDITSSPKVPIPRSFIEALKTNVESVRNDFTDSIGLGDPDFDTIFGRTVTKIAPPLTVPTDDQFIVMGALQQVSECLDKILCNNAFFQADADDIYKKAKTSYGEIASINQPDSVREIVIEAGDTLERIALREYGDALRWVDIVVLNKLKYPYILNTTDNVDGGVRRPGDKLLIGN